MKPSKLQFRLMSQRILAKNQLRIGRAMLMQQLYNLQYHKQIETMESQIHKLLAGAEDDDLPMDNLISWLIQATDETEFAVWQAQTNVEIARQRLQRGVKITRQQLHVEERELASRVQRWMDLKDMVKAATDGELSASGAPATAPDTPLAFLQKVAGVRRDP